MKRSIALAILICAGMLSCKKEKKSAPEEPAPAPVVNNDHYTSLKDFYNQNSPPLQTFNFNSSAGGTFVTAQNTTIQIPANAFTQNGSAKIQFKDIYKKSDMLLSNMSTNLHFNISQWQGKSALKSAGEFFIKATVNNMTVQLTPSVNIDILQPSPAAPPDTGMRAFAAIPDSAANMNMNWFPVPPNFYDLSFDPSGYIFSMYAFSTPADSGSWCNSDNSDFFNAYPQTTLTIHPNENIGADVYLVFKTVNSMVHVYQQITNFVYSYAPVGLECNVVCIGIKNNKLVASFTPITIANNQTVNFTMTEITTDEFKAKLRALD